MPSCAGSSFLVEQTYVPWSKDCVFFWCMVIPPSEMLAISIPIHALIQSGFGGVNPKHIRQLGSSSQVLKTTRTTHPQNGPKWVKMGQNGSGHALAIGRLAILQLPLLQVLQPTTDLSQTAGVIIKLPFQVEKVRKILQESQNIRIYLLSRSSYLWKCKIYHDSGRSKPWYPSVHTSS